MESGFPILNCLLQHTLKSLCSYSDSSKSSKWVYAVFWRILPRNYPPPKWDYGGTAVLDRRSKGNKRNWILVWEDGFCDFYECECLRNDCRGGRFGADVFFKMSHEVYSYGEGLVGKVAAENAHKWVFRETPGEADIAAVPLWNVSSVETQPRAWNAQFGSGIQTIAIISVKEGIVQLGSFDKIMEDLNLVISIQRKFSYLQSLPGVYAIQRPYLPLQHPYVLKPNTTQLLETQVTGTKRSYHEISDDSLDRSINFSYNILENRFPQLPFLSIPPLLPSSLPLCNDGIKATPYQRTKVVGSGLTRQVSLPDTTAECEALFHSFHEEKPFNAKDNDNSEVETKPVIELGFGTFQVRQDDAYDV